MQRPGASVSDSVPPAGRARAKGAAWGAGHLPLRQMCTGQGSWYPSAWMCSSAVTSVFPKVVFWMPTLCFNPVSAACSSECHVLISFLKKGALALHSRLFKAFMWFKKKRGMHNPTVPAHSGAVCCSANAHGHVGPWPGGRRRGQHHRRHPGHSGLHHQDGRHPRPPRGLHDADQRPWQRLQA